MNVRQMIGSLVLLAAVAGCAMGPTLAPPRVMLPSVGSMGKRAPTWSDQPVLGGTWGTLSPKMDALVLKDVVLYQGGGRMPQIEVLISSKTRVTAVHHWSKPEEAIALTKIPKGYSIQVSGLMLEGVKPQIDATKIKAVNPEE